MAIYKYKNYLDLLILLFLVCFFLTGCSDQLVSVDIAIIRAIVAYFVTSKSLNLVQRIDRHKAFFVFKRTEWLGARNSSWLSESNYTSLKTRIDEELIELEAYIQSKDDLLNGRLDHGAFPHLDINNVSQPKHTRSSRDRRRAVWYRRLRRERIYDIAWRSAALYPELWGGEASSLSATLKHPEMDFLLNRKLRSVERMQFQVSSVCSDRGRGGRLRETGCLGSRSWVERSGATGPWKDNFRVRMFEYARVGSSRTISAWESIIHSSNIGPGKDWDYGRRRTRLEYKGPLYPGDPTKGRPSARLPVSQQPHWYERAERKYHYRIILKPSGITASAVIDDMFKTHIDDDAYRLKDDWWHRSWLFCDHVIAAINIEALIFGLRRAKGNANDFDEMVDDRDGYVCLDWFVGRDDVNILMADNDDPYFLNTTTLKGDLQVGDQLIFWNSQLYGMIGRGDWRLENAYVMSVDSTSEGGIYFNRLVLQGHGTGLRKYPGFRNIIARTLNRSLQLTRAEIRDRVQDDPSIRQIDNWHGSKLIRWSPFGQTWRNRMRRRRYEDLGAWWVLVPVQDGENVDLVIEKLRRAFKIEDDFIPPTYSDGSTIPANKYVFFPIYEPIIRLTRSEQNQYRLKGTWQKYIDEKRSDPNYNVRSLRPMITDGILMPGIERRGENKPIPVVRCKYHELS